MKMKKALQLKMKRVMKRINQTKIQKRILLQNQFHHPTTVQNQANLRECPLVPLRNKALIEIENEVKNNRAPKFICSPA
jgi:hypothetical protein